VASPVPSVLVVDIGGSHVKMLATGQSSPRRFDSGKRLTPQDLVRGVREQTADWRFDVVAIGYPGHVDACGPVDEPGNLGRGWIRFDFQKAFECPARVVNDAVMQALGGYDGGRMLFLGLGTGLGSALVSERVAIPLELGCLPYGRDRTLFDQLGRAGLDRDGHDAWQRALHEITPRLREAFAADYVMLGGGNAKEVDPLPAHTRRGGNADAFAGGFRLWEEQIEPHDRPPSAVWRVVR
jgi:polyphosphate glucokinase